MARSAEAGPQTVIVNRRAQRLETGSGAAFRGLFYPADVICYSPPVLEMVHNTHELRALLARLGVEDGEKVIGDAETPAPVRARIDPDLYRAVAGVDEGWLRY